MRKKIEIEYPRTLLLENLVGVSLESLEPAVIQTAALAVNRHIRAGGGKPMGPLVQSVRTVMGSDGTPVQEARLLRQSKTAVPVDGPMAPVPKVLLEKCVLARFRGFAADIDVVYNKVSVFAYENSIELDGAVHLVFVEQSDDDQIMVDFFASSIGAP
jgi:hypothetical protein